MLFTAEGLVDFQGEYYTLKQAPFAPKAVQSPHPPIVVGGTGEKRTIRTAALYGDAMNVIAGPEEFKRLVGVLERHCEAAGRDPATIRKTVHVPMRIMADEARAKELRRGQDWNMIGPVPFVIDRVNDFIEAGVDEFMMSAIPNKPQVYEELDKEIISAFA